jgi:hypothetical protein
VIVGIASVVVAFSMFDELTRVAALTVSAIAYVSWTAGRSAGVGITILSTVALLRDDQLGQPGQAAFPAMLGLWTLVCLVVALTTSAIERGTRPNAE